MLPGVGKAPCPFRSTKPTRFTAYSGWRRNLRPAASKDELGKHEGENEPERIDEGQSTQNQPAASARESMAAAIADDLECPLCDARGWFRRAKRCRRHLSRIRSPGPPPAGSL